MTRILVLAALAGAVALVRADDPPKKLTPKAREELQSRWDDANAKAGKAYEAGQLVEAAKAAEVGLALARQLYNVADFPDGHDDLATATNNLGFLYQQQGKLAAAEPLYRDALAAFRRRHKDRDQPDVAANLNNLASLYQQQGKLAEAEPLYRDALAMRKRLFPGDHPDVASGLNNLGFLYLAQGKPAEAESLYRDALAMGRRLFPGDHPNVSRSLNNLGYLYLARGNPAAAEPLLRDALAMDKRLFPGDHPDVLDSLNYSALLCRARGKPAAAEPLLRDALAMQKRLATTYARMKSEGDALTYAADQPLTRDVYLSAARDQAAFDSGFNPAAAYPAVWATKGAVARVFEHRQLQARAAATDPAVAQQLARLADARRHRAELLLASGTADPDTRKAREAQLKALDEQITTLTSKTTAAFGPVARLERLDAAAAIDLQKALPPDAVLVDYVRYTFSQWDDTKPAGQKDTATPRYSAFVVTRDKVTWVDLNEASKVAPAANAWRAAVASGKPIPADLPVKVRSLVWEPVRKHLPAGVKTVYVCPDGDLCALPFAALPGDKPGTVLLEDFALATIPHAPFLLDKLLPQDPPTSKADRALVVGGVKYDAEVKSPDPALTARRGDPLVKPDQTLAWDFLGGTVDERKRVTAAAEARKLPVTALDGEAATAAAVLDALPTARVAHLATHGFFADPAFRGLFQLDDKDFQQTLRGERIGRAANNPLVMTGLVFAGANTPGTPGRGILTGEQLVDRDLSGLELAVLSACETGIGDLGAGGEGVFGLQRAFHYAGARDVVCSLWKVDDAATAALMGRFYAYLWAQNRSPMEALRQAQRDVYRADPKDFPVMAVGRGIGAGTKDLTGVPVAPAAGGGNHPALWAAFTLSGPGR